MAIEDMVYKGMCCLVCRCERHGSALVLRSQDFCLLVGLRLQFVRWITGHLVIKHHCRIRLWLRIATIRLRKLSIMITVVINKTLNVDVKIRPLNLSRKLTYLEPLKVAVQSDLHSHLRSKSLNRSHAKLT